MTNSLDGSADDVICRNRVYECQCGFVGREEAAEEHQCTCELPMELLK